MTKTFEQLTEQFLQDTISLEDLQLFLVAVKQPENAGSLKEKILLNLGSNASDGTEAAGDMEEKFKAMLERAEQISNDETKIVELSPGKKSFSIRRIAVAASFLLLAGTGSYFMFFKKAGKQEIITAKTEQVEIVAPNVNRAMITLSNGEQVYLDSAINGKLLQQNGVEIVKLSDGKIVYKGTATEVVYNTLSNPKGSKVIDMTLVDGSHVWLNAGSSITYPVAFVGNERNVSITGEAYFEVMHNTAMPFKVSKGEMEVTVLGTHFNVNAYDDEADIKVTLLEGSVRVSELTTHDSRLITPGQQVVLSHNSQLTTRSSVDIEQVMAWKDGVFRFKNTNIGEIMRQVARWYNLEIEYKSDLADLNFGGSVSRQENVSELLKRLEATEAVKFKIDGRKIVVMP